MYFHTHTDYLIAPYLHSVSKNYGFYIENPSPYHLPARTLDTNNNDSNLIRTVFINVTYP